MSKRRMQSALFLAALVGLIVHGLYHMAEASLLGFASRPLYFALNPFFRPDVLGWVIHVAIELAAMAGLFLALLQPREQVEEGKPGTAGP